MKYHKNVKQLKIYIILAKNIGVIKHAALYQQFCFRLGLVSEINSRNIEVHVIFNEF